jgi:hypothetical protein
MSNTQAKVEAPETRCQYLCGGQYGHALEVARRYEVSVESAEREHRTVHALDRKRLAGPGGAVVQVAELAGMEHQLREAEARLDGLLVNGCKEASERVKEQRAQIHNLKGSLAERKAFLATLPEEAKTDPRRAVADAEDELAAARATRDVQGIAAAGRKIDAARKRAAGWHADSMALGGEIQKAAARARKDLGISLFAAIAILKARLAGLTGDVAYLSAPELIDLKAIETLWREAGLIREAFLMICPDYNAPDVSEMFLNSVPEPLWDHVGGAIGLGHLPRLARGVMRESATA